MQPILHRLNNDTGVFVCNDPVKLCCRQLFTECCACQSHCCQLLSRLCYSSTLCKDPWDELELCHLADFCFIFRQSLFICRIADKIKTCHSKAFFINSIIIKRITSCNKCHSDQSIMAFYLPGKPEIKFVISWRYRNLFPIGKFIIKRSTHIKIFCFVSCCCTHIEHLFFLL